MKKLVPRSVSQLWISANFLKNQHVFLDTGIHFLKSCALLANFSRNQDVSHSYSFLKKVLLCARVWEPEPLGAGVFG